MGFKKQNSPLEQGWAGSILGNANPVGNVAPIPPAMPATNTVATNTGTSTIPTAEAVRANDIANYGSRVVRNDAGVSNNNIWMGRAIQNPAQMQPQDAQAQQVRSGLSTDPRGRNVQMNGMDLNQTGFVNSQKGSQITAMKGLYGNAMAGTAVTNNYGSPLAQMQDPNALQDTSVSPPTGVQQSISPYYDLSN